MKQLKTEIDIVTSVKQTIKNNTNSKTAENAHAV